MTKNFREWYNIRANIHPLLDENAVLVKEGFWGNVAKGALGGVVAGGTAGATLGGIGAIPGAIMGGLGGGAVMGGLGGALGAGVYPWMKRKATQISGAATRAAKDPAHYQDLNNPTVITGAQKLAQRLGLGKMVAREPELENSLKRIYMARVFGHDYGAIESGDLNFVWQAMQQPSPKNPNKTIAQDAGITRPMLIVGNVPDIRPGVRYGITPDAIQVDEDWMSHGRYENKASPAAPAPTTTAAAAQTPPPPGSQVPIAPPTTTGQSPPPSQPTGQSPPPSQPTGQSTSKSRISQKRQERAIKISMEVLKDDGVLDELQNVNAQIDTTSLKKYKASLLDIINNAATMGLKRKHVNALKSELKHL